MKTRNFLSILDVAMLATSNGVAAPNEYVRDYDYVATDDDSRFTSRIRALDGLKRSLLEELGTYVASVIKVNRDSLGKAYLT